MKEFKSVGSVCLTALIALSFLSCSTGQGGQTGAEVTVSLSSDRSSILADNIKIFPQDGASARVERLFR